MKEVVRHSRSWAAEIRRQNAIPLSSDGRFWGHLKGKGKAGPLQARSGQEGSAKLRFPDWPQDSPRCRYDRCRVYPKVEATEGRSQEWVYGRSLAGISGPNPARSIDVCLLWVSCVDRYRSLHWGWSIVQRSPTEYEVCLSVMEEPHRGGIGPLGLSSHGKKATEAYFWPPSPSSNGLGKGWIYYAPAE